MEVNLHVTERNEESDQDRQTFVGKLSWIGTTWAAVMTCAFRVLGWRYLPLVLVIGAIGVSLPAVGTGLLNDDYMHRSILMGPSPFTERLAERKLALNGSGDLGSVLSDLYVAVAPEGSLKALKAYGALPWWTYEGFRVAFWRPVAALTYWLDYRLFPDSAALMHLHSILWFAAVVGLLSVFYRRLIGVAPVAGLATLLFLLDDSSFFPTMWVANRNLLISLSFGLLAVILHDRWRRDRWRPGAVLAPLCLLLSVLSAEAGITTMAYLFAYEVMLSTGRWKSRLLALVPAAAVIVAWRVVYNLLGYGASGGGFYFDPVREPIGYALAFLQRAPFLLAGQLTTIPPELYSFMPPTTRTVLWLVLCVLTVLILLALWRFLRVHRRARFWLVGTILAVVPFCATLPMSRSLLFVGVGAFGLIAEYIAGWRAEIWNAPEGVVRLQPVYRDPMWIWGSARNLFVMFVVVHIPLAAVTRYMAPGLTAQMQEKVARTMDLGPMEDLGQQDLIIVNAPNPASFLYEPFILAYEGQTLPRATRVLAPGFGEVEVTRPSTNVLVVKSVSRTLFDCQQEGERTDFVFFYRYLSDVRGPDHPLKVGDRVDLARMTAEVRGVDARGFPLEVAFEFELSLEDASLKWLSWNWDKQRYQDFIPPPIGGAVTLVGPF